MQERKVKRKARRRAQRLLDRAWDAVDDGKPQLARREIERALRERQDNPALWNDYGLILEMQDELTDAERALRNAIVIAPTYAEAYANLAKVVARQGRTVQAERAKLMENTKSTTRSSPQEGDLPGGAIRPQSCPRAIVGTRAKADNPIVYATLRVQNLKSGRDSIWVLHKFRASAKGNTIAR